VAKVRILGAIGVVEMKEAVDGGKVQKQVSEHGVWLRPFGKLIYMMPPYIMQDESIIKMCNVIKSIL
jgi:adenosylmethionine-8-amino-7-oxononanoate aminotransferase